MINSPTSPNSNRYPELPINLLNDDSPRISEAEESSCSDTLCRVAQTVGLIFAGIIIFPLIGIAIIIRKIRSFAQHFFYPTYSFPAYQGFRIASNHFKEAKFIEPPKADERILINQGLNYLWDELNTYIVETNQLLDLSKVNQGKPVSFETLLSKFKEIALLYKNPINDNFYNEESGPQDLDSLSDEAIPKEGFFGKISGTNEKIQNYLRHIISTFHTRKKEWDQLPEDSAKRLKLKTAYYNELKTILLRMVALFFHCPNDIAAGLEEIYRDFIIHDEKFLKQSIESARLKNRGQCVLTQLRNTIFDQACSIKNDIESAGTQSWARYYYGEQYGVSSELSAEAADFEFTANTEAYDRIPQFFDEQYTIPEICNYLRSRINQPDEKLLKPKLVTHWIYQNFALFPPIDDDTKRVIESLDPEHDEYPVDPVDTEIVQQLIDENGNWTDDALMLLLEDWGTIEYTGEEPSPLDHYRKAIAEKRDAYTQGD